MSQATANPPDPSKSNDTAVRDGDLASADDLLSQLAGEEIDRLLAEADEAHPPQRQGSEPPQPDALFSELKMGPADESETPADKREATSDVAAQLDAVLSRAGRDEREQPQTPQGLDDELAREAQQSLHEDVEGLGDDERAMLDDQEALDEDEEEAEAGDAPIARDAPGIDFTDGKQPDPEPAPEEPSEALDEETEAIVEEDDDPIDVPLPLWLRPLEWINAPLAHCPAWVREAMGKVAILTLINALAVLLYVLLFRR